MKKIFVFKCGGGDAIKNADSIRRLLSILKEYQGVKIILVVSAFQGVTNNLEDVAKILASDWLKAEAMFQRIHQKHVAIARELGLGSEAFRKLDALYKEKLRVIGLLVTDKDTAPTYLYATIVSSGEMYSAIIVSEYIQEHDVKARQVQAVSIIKTTTNNWVASVDENTTYSEVQRFKEAFLPSDTDVVVIEGFIGSSNTDNPVVTTLGREGSDLTAATIATMIGAEEVIFFKKYAYFTHNPDTTPDAVHVPQVAFSDLEYDIRHPEGRKVILHGDTLTQINKNYGSGQPAIKIVQFSDTSMQTLVVR